MTNAFLQVKRLAPLLTFRAFDTSTVAGRSKERYRRAALTSITTVVSRGIGAGTLLASVPLTLRYLGPERYGLWMVLTSIISILGFADLGIGNGLMNAVSEAYGKQDHRLAKEYVSGSFFLMLGISSTLFVAGTFIYPFVPWLRLFNVKSAVVASEGARALVVLFSWFVLNIPLGVVTRVQMGLQQGYWSQVVGALGNILSLLALLLVIARHGGLASLAFASTFGIVIATVLNGWLLLRQHPWLWPSWAAYRRNSANRILKLGLMFFVLQCAVAVGYNSDNIVIAQNVSVAAVAVYAVPQKLFNSVSMLVSMGIAPLWPAYGEAITRGDVLWVRHAFWASLRITLWIAVPLCSLLALAGPSLLRLAVGKSLYVPVSLFAALAVWGILSAVSAPMSVLINGAGVLKIPATIAVVSSLTNIALSILLTRQHGVIGVCLGSIITQALIAIPACAVVIHKLFCSLEQRQCEGDGTQ